MREARFPLYSRVEVESYLPPGWRLAAEGSGEWDRPAEMWRIEVLDSARVVWDLQVGASEARRRGRIEALRQAIDALYRRRLK